MAHLEWTGLMNADGTKQMVWVDDYTQEEIDAKNKKALEYDPAAAEAMNKKLGGTVGGYSMSAYMADEMNAGVGTYADARNQPVAQTTSPKVLAAMKRAKATEAARQEQKKTAQSVVNATRDSLLGTIDKKWRWRS